MKINLKISSLLIFALLIIFISLIFYSRDGNFSIMDAMLSFIISLPLTPYTKWLISETKLCDYLDSL